MHAAILSHCVYRKKWHTSAASESHFLASTLAHVKCCTVDKTRGMSPSRNLRGGACDYEMHFGDQIDLTWQRAPEFMQLLDGYEILMKECGAGGDCLYKSAVTVFNRSGWNHQLLRIAVATERIKADTVDVYLRSWVEREMERTWEDRWSPTHVLSGSSFCTEAGILFPYYCVKDGVNVPCYRTTDGRFLHLIVHR